MDKGDKRARAWVQVDLAELQQNVRRLSALLPPGCNALDVQFDKECFAGETLRLETAPGGFVRGVKESGELSFHLRLRREDE